MKSKMNENMQNSKEYNVHLVCLTKCTEDRQILEISKNLRGLNCPKQKYHLMRNKNLFDNSKGKEQYYK